MSRRSPCPRARPVAAATVAEIRHAIQVAPDRGLSEVAAFQCYLQVMHDQRGVKLGVWFVSDPGLERDVYVSALQSAGFETEPAGSLEEIGERLVGGAEPALLVLDLLPVPEDSWRLISRLRAASPLAIIVFTSLVRPDRANRNRARQLGCAAFVAKPCSPNRLASVARQVCQGARGLEVIDYI